MMNLAGILDIMYINDRLQVGLILLTSALFAQVTVFVQAQSSRTSYIVTAINRSIYKGVIEAWLEIAFASGARNFLLDNFSKQDLEKAVSMKKEGMSYEVSGGINLENLESYLVEGIDAFSSGSLTYNAPQVDLSLKFDQV